MRRNLRQLTGPDLSGRRALVRVDYNVPVQDGEIRDATRIEASYPTLALLLDRGARPVLLSHLGRPGGEPDPRYSLQPVAAALAAGFGRPVRFCGPADSLEAVAASEGLGTGEILLLENTRFLLGETRNDAALAHRFAQLGELFVNEAFGTAHRAHASNFGVATLLKPAVAGLLIQREIETLDRVRLTEDPPFVVALGGAKIKDKIDLLEGFLSRAHRILIGGAMANTFLRARGFDLADSLVEAEAVKTAGEILERAGDVIELPVDLVVSSDPSRNEEPRIVAADSVPKGHSALDIGPRTRDRYGEAVRRSHTFFWNGPMGLFERPPYDDGTIALALAAADATEEGAFTVVGGGDSAAAVRRAGLVSSVSHVSTGGGAALEYLAKGTLPALEALDETGEPG
jgi:phosphoglycerate kinase